MMAPVTWSREIGLSGLDAGSVRRQALLTGRQVSESDAAGVG